MPNIAVFIEQRDGAIKKVAWQMISQARRLADAAGGEVWAVLLGGDANAAAGPAGCRIDSCSWQPDSTRSVAPHRSQRRGPP